ncbi:MAG TPA: hypothetical protein VFH22_14040 [Rhodocyclaceae bacterium]|nr:hypothetical protein [Rhodocyclaceae bacterium]
MITLADSPRPDRAGQPMFASSMAGGDVDKVNAGNHRAGIKIAFRKIPA